MRYICGIFLTVNSISSSKSDVESSESEERSRRLQILADPKLPEKSPSRTASHQSLEMEFSPKVAGLHPRTCWTGGTSFSWLDSVRGVSEHHRRGPTLSVVAFERWSL